MNKYKRSGWFSESARHSLARKGIKTKTAPSTSYFGSIDYAMKFVCGICKKGYSSPTKAEMCCWERKREIGHFNPNSTKEEIMKNIRNARVMILKKKILKRR